MATPSVRSDSSASTIHSSTTAALSSMAAKGEIRTRSQKGDASKVNGHAGGEADQEMRQTFGMRARSASLQKGVAVLRALARAPEGEGTSEVDSGYEDEGGEANVGAVPGKRNGKAVEGEEADVKLTKEAIESGRINREGLRKRNEQKEVEKLIGSRSQSSSKSDSSTVKRKEKRKSVLITEKPRKIFHGSIGFIVLYLYLWDIDLTKIVRNLSIFLGIVVTADIIRLNIGPFETFYEMVLGFLMRESEKTKVNGVVWYLVGVITCLSLYPADIACVSVMMLSWADTAASIFGRLYGAQTPALPSPPFARRKSTAGFLAAFVVASLTAAAFWATPIAQMGMRPEGLSIHNEYGRAAFGTSTMSGFLGNGWTGFKWGFRPSHPDSWATTAEPSQLLHKVTESFKKAAGSGLRGNSKAIPLPLLCIGSGLVAAVAEGLELGGVDDNLSLPILSSIGMHALIVSWGWISSRLL